MEEDPEALPDLKLRAEILELGSAIRQLQREGLDDAAAQLLIARKRAQLEHLVKANADGIGRFSDATRMELINAGCRNALRAGAR